MTESTNNAVRIDITPGPARLNRACSEIDGRVPEVALRVLDNRRFQDDEERPLLREQDIAQRFDPIDRQRRYARYAFNFCLLASVTNLLLGVVLEPGLILNVPVWAGFALCAHRMS